MPLSRAAIGTCAKVKMLWKTRAMRAMKINVPQILCVTTRSILSLGVSPAGPLSCVTLFRMRVAVRWRASIADVA